MRCLIILSLLLAALSVQLSAADIPRLVDLTLPEPLGHSSAKLERAQHESFGTGIGKYSYPTTADAPILSVAYILVDTSLELRPAAHETNKALSAASYLDRIMAFRKPGDVAKRQQIVDVDCVVSDYPDQEMPSAPGYLVKQFTIEFYFPEHQRVYEIRFEAFWSKDSKHPYEHRGTPRLLEKAIQDFANLYR